MKVLARFYCHYSLADYLLELAVIYNFGLLASDIVKCGKGFGLDLPNVGYFS
jgi:hypothetical protein